MQTEKVFKKVLAIFFLIIIGTAFILNVKVLLGLLRSEIEAVMNFNSANETKILVPKEIESRYNENFFGRLKFVDLNGLVARGMGQKIKNGVVKDRAGKLNLLDNTNYQFNSKEEKKKVSKAIAILEDARKQGSDILYVQRPWKNSESEENLPYGLHLDYSKQFDFWCQNMKAENFPVLDLRQSMGDYLEFYKTDHHWTIQSSFFAAGQIIEKLNEQYNLDLDKDCSQLNLKNYKTKTYQKSFLGSEGIKTGKYYAGKDDFTVLWPGFETNFKFQQYADHKLTLDKEGSFYSVFIDHEILEDPEYNNKYAAYGYNALIENRVKNENADNSLKALLISDSFSRPLFTFFSLCFSETRFLDPQEGRYTDSYIKYIEWYKPDVVVMMFPGDGTFQES